MPAVVPVGIGCWLLPTELFIRCRVVKVEIPTKLSTTENIKWAFWHRVAATRDNSEKVDKFVMDHLLGAVHIYDEGGRSSEITRWQNYVKYISISSWCCSASLTSSCSQCFLSSDFCFTSSLPRRAIFLSPYCRRCSPNVAQCTTEATWFIYLAVWSFENLYSSTMLMRSTISTDLVGKKNCADAVKLTPWKFYIASRIAVLLTIFFSLCSKLVSLRYLI